MNNKKIVAYSMSALMIAVVAQVWLAESEIEKVVKPKSNQDLSVGAKPENPSVFSREPLKSSANSVSDSDEVWISEGMRQQMVDVAAAYKENMRYPAYSTPLQSSDWSMLNPRAFVPQMVDLELQGLAAEIVLDQYVVHRNENLSVKVNIQRDEGSESTVSEVRLSLGVGQTIAATSYSSGEGVLTYTGEIPASELSRLSDSEVALNAVIYLDTGEQTQISTAFKLASTEATLTHLGSSFVDGSDLTIPAYFDVSTSGFYRVRANLFDKDSDTPISHINASFMLDEHENEGLIKIHASTLRSKGFEGPYVLRDFDITRGPAKPGDKTGYGLSESEEFSVQGFDLNSYSREPYHDPKNQQRLEFLQKMAGVQ